MRLERSESVEELVERLREVLAWSRAAEDRELREAMYTWAEHSPVVGDEGLPDLVTFKALEGEEMTRLLEVRARQWKAQLYERGVEHGMERGIERGMERGLERGLEQGLEQGLERGQAEERARGHARLRRMAELKFGAETAQRLEAWLARHAEPEAVDRASEWLIQCGDGAALLERIRSSHNGQDLSDPDG